MENAFIRSGVTAARDKFAFIEDKFGVDSDPKVNRFLYGDSTDSNWDAFILYLREKHGKSERDRTKVILDPPRRDGRLPSEYVAFVLDRAGDVTIEQIVKEMMLRELPNDVRLTITERVKNLGLEETAKVADSFFERDGRPLNRSNASVNAVRPSNEPTPPVRDDNEDIEVNAVRNGARPKQQDRSRTRDKSRPRTNGANYVHQNPDLCYFHDRYGAKARNCHQAGCKWDKTPNAQGPRRA